MFKLFLIFILLGIGLFLGTQYSEQQGYVLISAGNSILEMSVTTLVSLVIGCLCTVFVCLSLIKKVLRISLSIWNLSNISKLEKSYHCTNEGVIKLFEGDWKAAEKNVLRFSDHHDTPLLCYLVAAKAAQEMGNKRKRDQYLDFASQQKNSQLAVELTKAKQKIDESEFSLAFDILINLKKEYPNNCILLNLLKLVYLQLNLWRPLLDLLPALIKVRLINLEEKHKLIQRAQCGLLSDIAQEKGKQGLIDYWNQLPQKSKSDSHLMYCFAKQLIICKADSEAYVVVKKAIEKYPYSSVYYELLPEMSLTDSRPAILFLKHCLKRDGNNSAVHGAIARFYIRDKNWNEARRHLEKWVLSIH
ncbi:protein hemY [Candidatus Photodesmus blepharus]|uniref:Protein hemY n=1 Tax=Candidatus Photodesmus blepharonis TaxID=1179155 RepID=A0A084CNI2_9GAMM|nr:heme biosynthesis HemY N-terminal domain-containing protein [Candidatus Photodesmus blepharus]KEY91361.1 protein hemY [Candidatus Photodesmus blepharus]